MQKIVEECLEKYEGGNAYFHAMDDKIKYDPEILDELLNAIGYGRLLILNGAFGFQMVHHIEAQNKSYPYILLVGSPRKQEEISVYAMNLYGGKKAYPTGIFLDDTYFSGRTYYYVKGYIEAMFGYPIKEAYVAYDGSKHRDTNVQSLYRYYDYHDVLGNKL